VSVDQAIRRRYEASQPYLLDLEERLRSTLRQFASANHFLEDCRIKTLESVAEKIESGRYLKWDDVDDLVAASVVVPLVSDEVAVVQFLRDTFHELRIAPRGQVSKDPDVFRFDATRFYGRLRAPVGMTLDDLVPTFALTFEVQVPTLFEFAWARTTHALAYKAPRVDWRRQRLAAQLKATVEQIDMLVVHFEAAAGHVSEGRAAYLEDQGRIEQFFTALVDRRLIPREAVPKDWTRFADNLYRVLQAFAGTRTSGRGSRALATLPRAFEILEAYVKDNSADRFPRSLSLFQVALGALASSGEFTGTARNYCLPATADFRTLFPQAHVPATVFEVGEPG
jgi:ppGpp synthetase/RelA/SpoT-type nucleotidyltranferase